MTDAPLLDEFIRAFESLAEYGPTAILRLILTGP